MATVTKNTKSPVAEYQQWQPGDITAGDILDVRGSLNHSASSVTIESLGTASTVRFNVVKTIYQNHRWDNPWLPDAEFWDKPLSIGEVEDITKPEIDIEADSIQTWTADELAIDDIKIVVKGTGLKVTVT